MKAKVRKCAYVRVSTEAERAREQFAVSDTLL